MLQLTSDIINQILSFHGLSSAAIQLYLSGNRALQRKIEVSVTTLSLRAAGVFYCRRLPKIISKLGNLQSLSIVGSELLLHSPLPVLDVLLMVSSSLQELTIDLREEPTFRSFSNIPEMHVKYYKSFVTPLLSILKSFPRFHTLNLSSTLPISVSNIRNLPPSLTSLTCDVYEFDETLSEIYDALPPHLEHLKVDIKGKSFKPNYDRIPRTLTFFYFPWYSWPPKQDILSLPDSLIELDGSIPLEYFYDAPRRLFPNLQKLHASFSLADNYEAYLSRLPSCLTDLTLFGEIPLTPNLLRLLPPTLTHLNAQVELNDVSSRDWPSSLIHLELNTHKHNIYPMTPEAAATLPTRLHTLSLREFSDAKAFSLLKSLRRLNCSKSTWDEADFPPSLTEVTLAHYEFFSPSLLPPAVTYLHIAASILRANDLKFLPPSLTFLQVKELDNAVFDTEDAENVTRSREMLEMAGNSVLESQFENGSDLASTTASSTKVTLFSMLPRSLRVLRIPKLTHPELLPVEAWKHLPLLSELLFNTYVPADVVLQMPMQNIVKIAIMLDGVETQHFQALPRGINISSMMIGLKGTNAVSPIDLRYISPNLEKWTWANQSLFASVSTNLRKRRIAAFELGDSSELERLLSPEGITENDLKPLPSDESNTATPQPTNIFSFLEMMKMKE